MNTTLSRSLSMLEVKKFPPGAQPSETFPAESSVVDDLINLYTETGSEPDDGTRQRVHTYLSALKGYGRWLACTCLDRPAKDAPILFPQTVAGGITLVRNYDRADHSPDCPFNRPRRQMTDAPSTAPREPATAFGVLKLQPQRPASKLAQSGKIITQHSATTKTPTLGRILFTLFERARLHRIEGGAKRRNVSGDKDALRLALRDFSFDERGRIPIASYTRTSFAQLDSLKRLLTQKANQAWPGKLVPQGLIIDQVDDIDIDESTNEKWLIPPYGEKVAVPGTLLRPGTGTGGPYIVIALIALLPGQDQATLALAYVHPIYRLNELIPVDSGLERETLSILQRKQWQLQQAGRPFVIVKPLLDIPLEGGAKVRPDFILERADERCIVETMGYRDDGYRERKARTHADMKRIGPLIEHEPGQEKAFKSALAKIL